MKNFEKKASFHKWAAQISCICFLLGIFFGKYFLICLLFIFTGLSLGIIALFGIPKYGRKKILVPAILGIITNGLYFFGMIAVFLASYLKASKGF